MMSQLNNYDIWHSHNVQGNDTDAVWHNFAKRALHSGDLEQRMVLEIGCGRGGFSEYLMQQYPTMSALYACDYSESALAIARERARNSRIIWQKENIQKLSFNDASLDTVISCETVEHIPYPARALSEIYRVMKPGGKFILTCPNYFNLFGVWCLYRKLIGKPYTEGGQPYVNYIFAPYIYSKVKALGFIVESYHSSELVMPARRPKTFYFAKVPAWLKFFGNRTFYVLRKPLLST